jgi:hypothetical protein
MSVLFSAELFADVTLACKKQGAYPTVMVVRGWRRLFAGAKFSPQTKVRGTCQQREDEIRLSTPHACTSSETAFKIIILLLSIGQVSRYYA